MEKSWFKYGNFDTRDYPNLLIELLPNQNIPEKSADQTNVFGQNGSVIYPGGVKNTTRTYHIALISDEDDTVNRFGSLARFIDWQLRSQTINSELTDSYLVFPDDEIPRLSSQPDVAYNKKVYYIATYMSSEVISNIYNTAARVTVVFNVKPLCFSFEIFGYPATPIYYGMVITFNDDHTRISTTCPFYCLVGDAEHTTGKIYYQALNDFWRRGSELKLHAKALSDGLFFISMSYRAAYATIQSSTIYLQIDRQYKKNDEIIIDLQSGEVLDEYGGSVLKINEPYSEYISLPMTIQSLDDGRWPLVTSASAGSVKSDTMYNGDVSFNPSGNWSFSLEVIKHE